MKLDAVIKLSELDSEQLKWIQQRLQNGGFYDATIDGLFGQQTIEAFKKFKKQFYQAEPELISQGSVELLEAIEPVHKPSEQATRDNTQKSGKRLALPVVGNVYADDDIVEDGFLTWAEVYSRPGTNDCSRCCNTDLGVKNTIYLAKIYRNIRHKYGEPINITSANRPLKVNRAQGGVNNSYHIYDPLPGRGNRGAALDLSARDNAKIFQIAKADPLIAGIGVADNAVPGYRHTKDFNFNHIDTGVINPESSSNRVSRRYWAYRG